MNSRDVRLAVTAGILTSIFLTPTLYHLGIWSVPRFFALLVGVPALFTFGVWFGYFLSRWFGFFRQFGKFASVGFLSASIDFGVLNLLSILSGITRGLIIGGVNIPGFSLAVLNGYVWNKKWVFPSNDGETLFHDFPKFLAVTIGGLIINSSIIILTTTVITSGFGLSEEVWLNVAKVAANAIVLIWNFLGYKFIVFK